MRQPVTVRSPMGFAPVQQLGDAKIEQLRLAVGRDEDVAWLEVAVDDEALVCVADR